MGGGGETEDGTIYIYIFFGKILIVLHNFMSFFPFRPPGVPALALSRGARKKLKSSERKKSSGTKITIE